MNKFFTNIRWSIQYSTLTLVAFIALIALASIVGFAILMIGLKHCPITTLVSIFGISLSRLVYVGLKKD